MSALENVHAAPTLPLAPCADPEIITTTETHTNKHKIHATITVSLCYRQLSFSDPSLAIILEAFYAFNWKNRGFSRHVLDYVIGPEVAILEALCNTTKLGPCLSLWIHGFALCAMFSILQ